MAETEHVCFEPSPKKLERSPSPEPFREPDGMVTIDLNVQTVPPLLKRKLVKPKKVKLVKSFSYFLIITLLCLASFLVALLLHWDDISWFTSKFSASNKNETFVSEASRYVSNENIPIEMQTCPVNFHEEYKIQLLVCEKSQTFDACCHIYLRTNLPEINEVCSVIELLDLLIEYQKLFQRRLKRESNVDYTKQNYNDEMKKKLESKLRAKKKIMSYIKQLNEPLRREVPAIWNLFGDMFFGSKDDEEEMYQIEPIHKEGNHNDHRDYSHNTDHNHGNQYQDGHGNIHHSEKDYQDNIHNVPEQKLYHFESLQPNTNHTDHIEPVPFPQSVVELESNSEHQIKADFSPNIHIQNSPINFHHSDENENRESDEEKQNKPTFANGENYESFDNNQNEELSNVHEGLPKDSYDSRLGRGEVVMLPVSRQNSPDINATEVSHGGIKKETISSNIAEFSNIQDPLELKESILGSPYERELTKSSPQYYGQDIPPEQTTLPNNERQKRDELSDRYLEKHVSRRNVDDTNAEYYTPEDYQKMYNPSGETIAQYNKPYENMQFLGDYRGQIQPSDFQQAVENNGIVGNYPPKFEPSDPENYIPNPSYHSLMSDKTYMNSEQGIRLPINTEERNFGKHTLQEFNNFPPTRVEPEEYSTQTSNTEQFIVNDMPQKIDYSSQLPEIEDLNTRKISSKENYHEENKEATTEMTIETTEQYKPRPPQEFPRNNFEIVAPQDNENQVANEISFTTTLKYGRNVVDATDSIQNIDGIHGNNKSVTVDFRNTKIVLTKSKEKFTEDQSELFHETTDHSINSDSSIVEKGEFPDRGEEEKHKTDLKLATTVESRSRSPNLDFRDSPQQSDFNAKRKVSPFPSLNEEVQSTQNTVSNPCILAYPSPYGSAYRYSMPYETPQVLNVLPSSNVQKSTSVYVVNPSVFSYAPPSPVISHYGPIAQHYNPYGYVNTVTGVTGPSSVNGPVQVASTNGQYYLCNPIPIPANNQIANLPGVEVRRTNSNLQESVDTSFPENSPSNRTRAALNCPMDEQSCLDESKCISVRHVCDNEVHCEDGSDEMFCSCKDRIMEIRLCDGYYDCPDGEDERGCFGCSEDEISCDDWSRFRKGTCVPLTQRCDGIRQCDVTGKDEDDCSILTDHVGERNPIKISNSAGFLHRNFKGKWYPTCFGSELWAMDVCKIEAGPSTIAPKSHLILTSQKYEGDFINILPNQEVSLVNTCVQDRAAFVECPPIFCGLRMSVRNPYRPQEVDTSLEDIGNHFNRQSNISVDDFDFSRNIEDVETASKKSKDPILGRERVVGGKPSQPAAWPWVVSIYKNGIFHCGGVIINELWIVTAAHCVDKYWQFYYEVQAGILRRFSYSPMEQTRWVVAAIPHEDYEKSNLKNDIALMKLSSPVRYNRYVRPICLPSETTAGRDFLRGPPPGTICTTVGWGATVEHGTDPDHMREVEVPTLESCKHREDEEGHEICAGLYEGGKDACQGDSGGPFMCKNPNNPSQWHLAGIVSHGEGCARPNEPGVYTRVSQYIGWIAESTREGNFFPRVPLKKCPGYVCKGINKCIPKKRHCDKIVDCLMGDDEVSCENSFHNIFKHSRDTLIPFFRSNSEDKIENQDDSVLGAVIINSNNDEINTETTTTTFDIGRVQSENSSQIIIYKYERRKYSNNNTEDSTIFRCSRMLQIIPVEKRCNKIIDCEDATDEKDCKCIDYIRLQDQDAICDGIVDCDDESDEQFCSNCEQEEYNCKRSQMCISLKLRCDGKPDCTKGEDEWDCIALTNGRTLVLDDNLRPNLNINGIISVNHFGTWRPYCQSTSRNTKSDAEIATNVCNYLGFEEYTNFKKIETENRTLNIEWYNTGVINQTQTNGTKCAGLYLWCSNITLNNDIFKITQRNMEIDSDEFYDAPWNAAIFADGKYKCMGVILDKQWVMTSGNCFDGILSYKLVYLAVILGKGSRNLKIGSPHEKTVKIMKSLEVNDTDIILLKLEHDINFNRYIQPAVLSSRVDTQRGAKCMAIGRTNGRTKFVFLKSNRTCSLGSQLCFNAVKTDNCSNSQWSGVITCNSGSGWYPASVFQTKDGICGFNRPTNFTNIKFWAQEIKQLIKKNADGIDMPSFFCDGFMCNLGNCLAKKKVCDGTPHCRNGEDEEPFICEEVNNSCHLSGTCACPKDHLTCANGLCVPKEKFCDRNNDCGDYSDEPDLCTCRAYLQLAHPEKICDGEINCIDRSDEDPRFCQCKLTDFRCEKNLCIANEMVCDGTEDCPNGKDESECYSLISNNSRANAGEVLTRTAGQFMNSCFTDEPSLTTLNEICKQLSFKHCIGSQLKPYPEGNSTVLVPVLDTFNVVWIRRDRNVPLMYQFRTGNDAYLSFRKRNNCHRLYVECI